MIETWLAVERIPSVSASDVGSSLPTNSVIAGELIIGGYFKQDECVVVIRSSS
jgi:hypothetical protein